MNNENDLEKFSGFAGQNAETKRNITDDEMLNILHKNNKLMNLFAAYQTGIISPEKFNELVQQGIELSKNPEGK